MQFEQLIGDVSLITFFWDTVSLSFLLVAYPDRLLYLCLD